LQLGEHAGKIIKSVHVSGSYDSQNKEKLEGGFQDLFTIADTTIQKTIEYNLK
jgi:hypothetical protein